MRSKPFVGVAKVLVDYFNFAENRHEVNNSGHNLILTIDNNIQFITESALQEAVDQYSAQNAIAVVMQPRTGAILALALYPLFNPNAYTNFDKSYWRNRAITDPIEPGSIMKIFSAAAALEYGNVSPNTIFFCENGSYKVGKNVVHDVHEHGWLSLQQIIKYSSNIGAVKVGEKVGRENLYQTLRDFGFGAKTGIDSPGETTGSLSHYSRWSEIAARSCLPVAVRALRFAAREASARWMCLLPS